ncbi:hypothetical protein OPQ81_005549 [Rhizoctonia solani]|nr:hypothetical protein OPQ81_005549 [Rhizoctonia solani]
MQARFGRARSNRQIWTWKIYLNAIIGNCQFTLNGLTSSQRHVGHKKPYPRVTASRPYQDITALPAQTMDSLALHSTSTPITIWIHTT